MRHIPDLATASLGRRATYGALLPLHAARWLLRHRQTWPILLAPMLLVGLLLGASAWAAWSWGFDAADALLHRPAGDSLAARALRGAWVLYAVGVELLVFLALAVASWVTGGVLASPFHDRLSGDVEDAERGAPTSTRPWTAVSIVTEIATSGAHAAASVMIYAAGSCLLLLFGLIPIAGEIASVVLGAAWSALFLAWQTLDYPLSRRALSFAAKVRFLVAHYAVLQAMGLVMLAMVTVPGTNLLAMPVAVVAATLLTLDVEAAGHRLTPDR